MHSVARRLFKPLITNIKIKKHTPKTRGKNTACTRNDSLPLVYSYRSEYFQNDLIVVSYILDIDKVKIPKSNYLFEFV